MFLPTRSPRAGDPLVQLNLDGVHFKSKVISKNLNPLWMESFTFPCDDLENTLSLVVEDYDLVSGNDFMGQTSVTLNHFSRIDEREVMRSWFNLAPKGVKLAEPKKDGEKKSRLLGRKKKKKAEGDLGAETNLGRVEVALRWVHNPTRVVHLPAHILAEEPKPEEPPNSLLIALVRGRNLPIMDTAMFGKGGSSDPFVTFEVEQERTKSTVKKKDLNPLWSESFELPAEDAKGKVVVTVWDYDVMSDPDHMGHFELSFVALADRKVTRRWFGLRDAKKQKVTGKVECAFRWYHNPDFSITLPKEMTEPEPYIDMPPNQLRICLMRGRELPIMDRALFSLSKNTGSSDPYAKLTVDGQVFVSAVKEQCLCPVWMERYDVPIDDIENKVLDVALYDKDEGSKDDLMGKIKIPLKPTTRRVLVKEWYTLANTEREAKRAMDKLAAKGGEEDDEGSKASHTDTKTGEVQVALRLVYNPKCRVSYYDLEDPADLGRISEICIRAVEDQRDEPLKLLVVRCATCRHVLVDKVRGITPAMVAAARPAASLTMNLLYRLKCDLDQQDGAGRSAMHIAARYDSRAVVRVLAQLDGDIELPDKYGKRPVHYAAEMGNEAVLRSLVSLGAALDEETDNGKTCASLAAANGHTAMLELLHKLGADVDQAAEGFAARRPLHFAAANGHLPCIKALLRLGADIDAPDRQLNTPVLHAALNGRKDIVEFLEEAECDIDHENSDGLDAKSLLALNYNPANNVDDDLGSVGSYQSYG